MRQAEGERHLKYETFIFISMILRVQEVITAVRMGQTGHTEQEKELEQMSETELYW